MVLPLPYKQCNFTCHPTKWFGGILHGKKTSTTYTWQMPSVTLLDTTTSAKPFTPSSRRDARRLFLAAWDSADILEKSPSRQLNAMVRPIYKNKIFFYKYRHIQVSRYTYYESTRDTMSYLWVVPWWQILRVFRYFKLMWRHQNTVIRSHVRIPWSLIYDVLWWRHNILESQRSRAISH